MSEALNPVAAAPAEAAPVEVTGTGLVDGAVAGEGAKSSEAGQGEAAQADGQGAGNEKPADAGAPAEVEKPKDGEAKADAPGAPADGKYADFIVPEGVELSGDMLEGVTSLAKAHNLNQSQAQALVDLGVKQAAAIAERFTEQVAKAPVALPALWAKTWSEQTSADPTLGGENLKTTMALATRVFATFATPELGTFLNETGLAHHPELIRFMNKVGKAVSEDTLVTPAGGGGGKTPTGRDPAKKLYPGMA